MSRGDRERLDRQAGRVRTAARRLRLAELAVSTDRDEGYGLPLADAATLAGLDVDRAGRMVACHREQVRAARRGRRRPGARTLDATEHLTSSC